MTHTWLLPRGNVPVVIPAKVCSHFFFFWSFCMAALCLMRIYLLCFFVSTNGSLYRAFHQCLSCLPLAQLSKVTTVLLDSTIIICDPSFVRTTWLTQHPTSFYFETKRTLRIWLLFQSAKKIQVVYVVVENNWRKNQRTTLNCNKVDWPFRSGVGKYWPLFFLINLLNKALLYM